MGEWTQAEQYLLEEIRRGNQQAWTQLVDRYQGRLVAFARRRLPSGADPEDFVQDTFLRFLRGLADFRGQASVETFLFMILRRRLIELFRGRRVHVASIAESSEEVDPPLSSDLSASDYARRDEHRQAAGAALAIALRGLAGSLQQEANFRDLKVLEMVFFAQRQNQEIAAALGLRPEQIALIKHRWLKQVRERVEPILRHRMGSVGEGLADPGVLDSLLTEIWANERLTCPKRSTIGGYLLGTLEEPWQNYVEFHVNTLGCTFCRANLEDLQKQTAVDPRALRDRIIQSTVGFFRKG